MKDIDTTAGFAEASSSASTAGGKSAKGKKDDKAASMMTIYNRGETIFI